ncbi:MAG: SCO family protein [Rhodospirillales bacterium]
MQTLRIVVIVLVVAVSAGGFWFAYQSGVLGPQTSRVLQGSNGPKIGGPFELVNHWGETTTAEDFKGSYMLVFFGYTYCPDVCPVTLSNVSTALDMLGDDAAKVTPLFVTVDPERDTVDQLSEYVKYFHPAIIGLTGSEQQIADVTKAYGVYYAKADGGTGDPQDYLMDHTSITYLMTPENTYAAHFSHSATAEDMAAGIRRVLDGG